MAELTIDAADIAAVLRKNVEGFRPEIDRAQVGRVLEVGDGIARVSRVFPTRPSTSCSSSKVVRKVSRSTSKKRRSAPSFSARPTKSKKVSSLPQPVASFRSRSATRCWVES